MIAISQLPLGNRDIIETMLPARDSWAEPAPGAEPEAKAATLRRGRAVMPHIGRQSRDEETLNGVS
jgi:hypothetical protein